jgi:hypothetical protein
MSAKKSKTRPIEMELQIVEESNGDVSVNYRSDDARAIYFVHAIVEALAASEGRAAELY